MMIRTTSLKCLLLTFVFYLLSFSIGLAEEEKRMCPNLQEYINDGKGGNCLLCNIYKVIAKVCVSVVEISWDSFAVALQGVVSLAAAIYIAVYTLKNIGSFSQQDSAAYLSNEKTGIIPLGVKVAAVIFLLNSQEFTYSYIIGPVITAGMKIGIMITGEGLGESFMSTSNISALFDAVIQYIQKFNDQLYTVVALGRLLMCLAFLPDSILDWHFHLIPFGAVLYIFGWMLLIGTGFYLLDVLFRLAVACMVLPIAIACGISKITSVYTKKTWSLFVNVFFNFIMVGMILKFTIDMILEAMSGNSNLLRLLSEKSVLTDSDAKDIAKDISISSFLLTTICCMVAFKLFMEIENITDNVSSSTSVGKLGQKTGAMAAQVVQKPLTKVTREGIKFADTARREAGKEISETKPMLNLRSAGRKIKSGVKRFVGL